MGKGISDSATRAQVMGGSLRRAIPILVAAQQLHVTGASPADSIVEAQILNLAEKWINASGAAKMSSAQAVEEIKKDSAGEYDSMIVDAFVKAFGRKSQAAQ